MIHIDVEEQAIKEKRENICYSGDVAAAEPQRNKYTAK